MNKVRIAILTVSDRAHSGEYEDRTGPAIADALPRLIAGAAIAETLTIPDEQATIEHTVRSWCDDDKADLVILNGGTGLSTRDVTPESVRAVIETEVPGLAEAMRAAGRLLVLTADLSRQVAGVRRRSLVVALPGSVNGAIQSLEAIADALPHAVELSRSRTLRPVGPERSIVGLSRTTLDVGALVARIRTPASGAVAVFEGTTKARSSDESRSSAKTVVALEYEAHERLALKSLNAVAATAHERWDLQGVLAVHRTGRVPVGEPGVVIAVSSEHRNSAFDSLRFIIDHLKSDVFIWKRELYDDLTSFWVGSDLLGSKRP